MVIRHTKESDLRAVMEIIADAQRNIGALGIDQWQDGYPGEDVISADMNAGISYVYCDGDMIIGTVAVLFGGEPTYAEIFDGDWLTNGAYAAIHRIAVKSDGRRHGIASAIIAEAEKIAVERGVQSLRVDTHRGNIPMRSMLEKNGFKYCGIIYLNNEKHMERVAYERPIKTVEL